MADKKVTELTDLASPALTDLLLAVVTPGGTPGSRKLTIQNLLTLLQGTLFRQVAIQVKTDTSGTYTPTSGMKYVLGIAVGGGGGAPADTTADVAVSGGGGGGAAIRLMSASDIGASKAYVVGQSSTSGGNTTGLGVANALLQATGGAVGVSTGNSTGAIAKGGQGGIGSNGDVNIRGGSGTHGITLSTSLGCGGNGGNSIFGGGGRGGVTTEQGEAGGAYGGGAGGGHTSDGTDLSAVSGAGGVLILIEFI